jgi:hypothetical protein
MDKAAAAEYLGVSTRTIERFAATGRLSKGRAKGKTRPVVVFDNDELESLKKELQAARPTEVFRRLNTEKPKDAIGFRLDPFYVKRLEEEGQREGMSAAAYARRLVVRGLEVGDELAAMKKSIGGMFYLILVSKLGATEAEADEILRGIEEGR